MILKYVRDSLPWLVPSAAIVFAASGFLKDGDKTEVAQTAPAAATFSAPAPQPDTPQIATVANEAALGEEEIVARQSNASDPLSDLQPAAPLAAPLAAVEAPVVAPTPQPQDQRQASLSAAPAATPFFSSDATSAQDQVQCIEDLRNLANQATVYFPSGGLTADAGGIEQGRLIGLVAQSCPGVQIRVEGHSDPSGDPAANLRLSEQRASQVIQRIAASGLDTSMFFPEGMGDREPSGKVGPQPRAFYDRRVEFSIVDNVTRVSVRAQPAVANPWSSAACVTELERAVANTALFYAPRSVSLQSNDLETALGLATLAMECPHARLRVIGHHTGDVQAREDVKTGLLRAKALMAMLVGRGVAPEQIIIAAPSRALNESGLPGSRVNFDIILEEG
ncbi:OmpA family protein [uncultured Tateyamaria sp.]|uniref:OmpA family protein n=1 Tax=uncultured Tateyamaria sp. TaxID=455651 RepID=UPI00261BCC87|nr:OmpA family protein [uncultured Tateyamaria sp.]